MKKPLIVANLKLYIDDLDSAIAYAKKVARGASRSRASLVVCPPTPFIERMGHVLARGGVAVGAQAVSGERVGAHTGEVSAPAVRSAGASYVIVGHSERRAAGASLEQIQKELASVLESGLTAILCVGEESRDEASGDHFARIEEELRSALGGIDGADARKLIIAYEPIWAIGKTAGDALSPEGLEEMLLYIRKVLADILGRKRGLSTPILYGGSVEPDNAHALTRSGCAGFLVGHASVEPESLLMIAREASLSAQPGGTRTKR